MIGWRRFGLGLLWISLALFIEGIIENPSIIHEGPLAILRFAFHQVSPHVGIGILTGTTLRVMLRLFRIQKAPTTRTLILFITYLSGLVDLYGAAKTGNLLAIVVLVAILLSFLMFFIPAMGCALAMTAVFLVLLGIAFLIF